MKIIEIDAMQSYAVYHVRELPDVVVKQFYSGVGPYFARTWEYDPTWGPQSPGYLTQHDAEEAVYHYHVHGTWPRAVLSWWEKLIGKLNSLLD